MNHSTYDRQAIGARPCAMVLVLLTIAAVTFAVVNWRQRVSFDVPDDGVSWVDSGRGVEAIFVAPDSPGDRAGIKSGDLLV